MHCRGEEGRGGKGYYEPRQRKDYGWLSYMYGTQAHTALHTHSYLFLLNSHYFMRLTGKLSRCKDEKAKVHKLA